MLKSIEYSVFFPATGRTLAGKFSFQKGLGSITGPNEAGKSFVIEMIRFAFFGTDALRGKVDEYKKLFCKMVFVVKGSTYTVNRKSGNATLSRGDEVIATGTRAVNEKIAAEVLGYSLAVFDMANVANQDKLLELGELKPSERKRAVDSVIGLGAIEDLSRWANEQALERSREADTIQRVIRVPVEPERPQGYRIAAEIDAEISALRAEKTTYDNLQGILSVNRTQPKKPETKIDLPSEQILTFAEDQDAAIAKLRVLQENLKVVPVEPPISQNEIDDMDRGLGAYDCWQAAERFRAQHHEPVISKADLEQMKSDWDLISRCNHNDSLKQVREELLDYGSHTCPKCAHSWPVAEADLAKVAEPEDLVRPIPPKLNRSEIERQFELHRDYEATLSERRQHETVERVEKPTYSRPQLEQFRIAWARCGDRPALVQQIADLELQIKTQPRYRMMYQERLAYEQALARYFDEIATYHEWVTSRNEAQAQAADIEPRIRNLPGLHILWSEAISYERSVFEYDRDLKNYTERVQELEALRVDADGWKRGKEALVILRTLVKQHLIPSLNKVASALLQAMTGNQRQSIVVSEDFDILVDGQALNTLSGSGKAVANLALRIGLGQVLTNNVLSLFMGDEIDASMDADRAENTSNTLQALKKSISQILLVTHKSPSADYNLALGTSHANSNGSGQRGTQKVGG
jgi:DNA repair exonuclease SbcCD ATPase subunit